MKPYSNSYCVGYCSKDGEQYIKPLQRNEADDMLFTDTILEVDIKLEELNSVRYKAPSQSLYKYICLQAKHNKNYFGVNEPSLYETDSELTTKLISLLRFFNLNLKDLEQTTASEKALATVVKKCSSYLKKYISPEILSTYVKQIQMFSNIVNILSFVPDEIREKKLPFWSSYVVELFPDKIIWPLTSGIQTSVTKQCNAFNLNLSDLLTDKKKFKQMVYSIKKTLNEPYKQELLQMVSQSFANIQSLLEEELCFAASFNDAEFLSELNVLQDALTLSKETIFSLEKCVSKRTTSMYKIKFLDAVHKRIHQLKQIIDDERHFALRDNNTLGLAELSSMENSLSDLESTIEKTVTTLFESQQTINLSLLRGWWPDLLHPCPANIFGFTDDQYEHRNTLKLSLENIEKYFLKDIQNS